MYWYQDEHGVMWQSAPPDWGWVQVGGTEENCESSEANVQEGAQESTFQDLMQSARDTGMGDQPTEFEKLARAGPRTEPIHDPLTSKQHVYGAASAVLPS